MSITIARGRIRDGKPEVQIVADIIRAGKVVGQRCYGWHAEDAATWNGIDIDEDYVRGLTGHCDKFAWPGGAS